MLRLRDAIVFRLTGRRRNRGTTPVYPQWEMTASGCWTTTETHTWGPPDELPT